MQREETIPKVPGHGLQQRQLRSQGNNQFTKPNNTSHQSPAKMSSRQDDSHITVETPLSQGSPEPGPSGIRFPAATLSGTDRTTPRNKSKPKGKGKTKEDPNAPPPWATRLFDELQEVRANQAQFQEWFQEMEHRVNSQRTSQSRPYSMDSKVRERFSKTPALEQETNPGDPSSEKEGHSPRLTNTTQLRKAKKTSKLEDPDPLKDGISPTFDLWLTGILDKFDVNHDHFEDDAAKCAYIYRRTTGDAQQHLYPRWKRTSKERYQTPEEMIQTLADIYRDPEEEENARLDYLDLEMRRGQTFSEFYTRFLHLAGTANIPRSEMKRDLPQKLTRKLQEALLPTLHSFRDYQSIAEQCIRLDQGLRRIAAQATKNRPSYQTSTTKTDRVPVAGVVPARPGILPVSRQLTAPDTVSSAAPTQTRRAITSKPSYANPQRQYESNSGLCFNCGKSGHLKADCPEPKKPNVQVLEIDEEGRFEEVEEDSGQSGNEDP